MTLHNYSAVAEAMPRMKLCPPRLRRAVLPLNSSCMTLVTFSLVAVENSYILSRRLRHHCAIIIVFFVAFVVIIGLFVIVSSSSLLISL